AVEMERIAGLPTVILRLAAIYGPGRGVRERLLAGTYQLVDEGAHYFSRVHVDDLVSIMCVAAERAPVGAVYCVADDRPTTQRDRRGADRRGAAGAADGDRSLQSVRRPLLRRRHRVRALPAHPRAAVAAEGRRRARPPRRAVLPDRAPGRGAVDEGPDPRAR